MAVKWAWGFSTDQTRAKLDAVGWNFTHAANTLDATHTHTYTGDAVSKRSAALLVSAQLVYTPLGVAALDGWVAFSIYASINWRAVGIFAIDNSTAGQAFYLHMTSGAATSTVTFYMNSVFQAASATAISIGQWHWIAIKYEATTTTWKGTVYRNGVEFIPEQTQTGAPAWSNVALMRPTLYGNAETGPPYNSIATWVGDIVTYDSLSDSGEVEVFCSTIEPTSDDSTVGTWTPGGTGPPASDHAAATPWDTATYTEDAVGTSGNLVRMGCPSISTHLGIAPTVHAIVSQAVVEGGSDFQALFNDGTSDSVGATVTSGASTPTYGYKTVTSGLTASTTVKVGVKVP